MNIMGELLAPIRANLFGYDMLIILMAVGTFGYLLFILWYANKVYSTIHAEAYLPDDVYDELDAAPPTRGEIKRMKTKLRKMRETSEKYYTMFVTLTNIFPLMGILGTVIALIPMVQHVENIQQNFYIALTSTLWGLIFAIFFKILDGVLLPRIERNNRGIEDYLEKLEHTLSELKETPAPKTKTHAPL